MDRELLIEIGCEELPAAWLPGVTRQIGQHLERRLGEARLAPLAPVETFSTPRRLTLRVARLSERQTDLEELVTGPPVSAAYAADGKPTPAAEGFARKQGVDVSALERVETPRGAYIGYRRRQRGRAAVDVLPDVLADTLRDMAFPKPMRWDAWIDDGRGEFPFGRPIRWILFLYGGRVVPFEIRRKDEALAPGIQDVRSGSVTYGHRFLTTSGRAGRAIKVKGFDDYRARLHENFVLLDRGERHDKIARELDAKAQRLSGRVSSDGAHQSLLEEVPDLVEYPSVVAGTFAAEFTRDLPPEVLVTTMVHHQHFFPVVDDQGRLKPAFLAVTNTQPENERTIARNAERVLTARLRDARFFWESDRRATLESRLARLETILFHKKLGTYRGKAERIEALARWIAEKALDSPAAAPHAARAARLAKADLATEMVREFTELQGTMGGIYAREEGEPEEVWKAIYFHYLPVGVEPASPPTRQQLGRAAVSWAAVSLADKLDTLVGLFFKAGERPTGSRDPFGLRRQGNGVFKILIDLPALTGLSVQPTLRPLIETTQEIIGRMLEWNDWDANATFYDFLYERLSYVLEQRGFDVRNVRAVLRRTPLGDSSPTQAYQILQVLPEFTESPDFQMLATAFKRVRNIARELPDDEYDSLDQSTAMGLEAQLKEPAERALLDELKVREPIIEGVVAARENYRKAFAEAAKFGPAVDRFFTEVFVMVDDRELRTARLRLMKRLERLILKLADVSEIVPES